MSKNHYFNTKNLEVSEKTSKLVHEKEKYRCSHLDNIQFNKFNSLFFQKGGL